MAVIKRNGRERGWSVCMSEGLKKKEKEGDKAAAE